jgi:hypothetical protein
MTAATGLGLRNEVTYQIAKRGNRHMRMSG